MVPSRQTSVASGIAVGLLTAAPALWMLDAGPVLAASAALFVGLATALSLWGPPRLQWASDDDHAPGVFEFGLIAGVSVVPTFAIFPVFVLDALPLGTQIALVALVLGVGFTGFGGCASLLAFSHYHYGNTLEFADPGATAE